MSNGGLQVGRVLRAGTRGFAIGCAVMQPDIPAFGSFVRAEGQAPGSAIYGLIYDVSVEDDPFVRQFISANPPEEVVRDQRENRQVPIEVSVLAVGCSDGDVIRHRLPAQPPVTLDWLYQCTDEEVRAFTARFDYFRLVLEAREVPADELLAASLRAAAAVRPESEQETFLVEAGRELTRLLAADPVRLEGLLRRLQA
ncbi:MAG: hypothetical protein DRI79_06720 [Chloroflexi bacterium]|nr:MAG: hypothetical protein DRI80_13445 [Chloroflexota bacterium]RLC89516.1 MAG: hypothetical protein DRI79_06720 [Chloroflexota bacterium]HEY67765.1 hypothetical protein [Thermoflexia bacterium]